MGCTARNMIRPWNGNPSPIGGHTIESQDFDGMETAHDLTQWQGKGCFHVLLRCAQGQGPIPRCCFSIIVSIQQEAGVFKRVFSKVYETVILKNWILVILPVETVCMCATSRNKNDLYSRLSYVWKSKEYRNKGLLTSRHWLRIYVARIRMGRLECCEAVQMSSLWGILVQVFLYGCKLPGHAGAQLRGNIGPDSYMDVRLRL